MTNRTHSDNYYLVLSEKGQQTAKAFALENGKNAENWNMDAFYSEVEDSLNNTLEGESIMHELSQFDSVSGAPVLLGLDESDVEGRELD